MATLALLATLAIGCSPLGRLGATSTATPTAVDAATNWRVVAVTLDGACATKTDDTLWCWRAAYPTATLSNLQPENPPTQVPTQIGTDASWQSVRASGTSICALKPSGEHHCSGHGPRGLATDFSNEFVRVALP